MWQVVKLILQGILLIPPDECPDFIYKMMAATWKTEPKDRSSFSDILDAFIVSNCTCRHRLATHSGRRRQSSRKGSPELLPSLCEVDEGTDDDTAEGMACSRNRADADVTLDTEDQEERSVCHLQQQKEDPAYMVPRELEAVVVSRTPR